RGHGRSRSRGAQAGVRGDDDDAKDRHRRDRGRAAGRMLVLVLYGHPFSSYTWKALIALYDRAIPFKFRSMEEEGSGPVVIAASPLGKFPLLVDGDEQVFEATAIIEWLAATRTEGAGLIPSDPREAVRARM